MENGYGTNIVKNYNYFQKQLASKLEQIKLQYQQ